MMHIVTFSDDVTMQPFQKPPDEALVGYKQYERLGDFKIQVILQLESRMYNCNGGGCEVKSDSVAWSY